MKKLITICLLTVAFIDARIAHGADSLARIYFLDQLNDVLWTSNLDGSGRTSLLTLDSNPWDIDLDLAAGKLYWTQSDKVLRANLDGTDLEVLWQPGPIALKGIAVDAAAGKLYFLDQVNKVLWTSNLDGSERTSLLTLDSNPWDIDLDLVAGKIYWTQSNKVLRADLDGTDLEVFWHPSLKGIAVNPAAGKLYFVDQLNDVLWTSNLDGSGKTSLFTLDSNPWDIDLDLVAGKIYWTQSNKVLRADLGGTDLEVFWHPSLKGIAVIPEPAEVHVSVDIKPEFCPNRFNVERKELIEVAILGTEDFDVGEISPATVVLSREGVAEIVEPLDFRWAYEDVATPFEAELCDCHALGPDGFVDLTLTFSTTELARVLQLSEVVGETVELTLTGNLRDEFGDTPILGEDCIEVFLSEFCAVNVGMTTATLCGRVIDAGGQIWEYRFRYCEEGGPDSYTPWSSDFEAADESFCQDIAGLSPRCRYYCSIQVRNSAGESWLYGGSLTTLSGLLELQAPNGGTYLAGRRCLICWKADPTLSNSSVLIEYSTDSGTSWNTVGTVANHDEWRSYTGGHYSWYPPAVSSNDCLVRISDTSDPSIFDVSDSTFSIVP